MINDDYKAKFRKVLKSNAIYFVLGFCLLAAGIAGISVTSVKSPSVQETTTGKYDNIVIPEVTTEKEQKNDPLEIDIEEFTTKKEEEHSTEAVFENKAPKVEEETTKEKPVIFYSPLSLSVSKDYSMGIPVFSQTMKDYRTHNGVDFIGIKGENVKTTPSCLAEALRSSEASCLTGTRQLITEKY